ncbi:MAG TPA: DUF3037 domain-containing protein [Parapedobacter sp.]|uniref:DUF3037 domain-containing protein n=1 Tax=Parapedobacter sp. TaxID=1958893 RepID=UPI002CCA9A04|nr:DUF3037 domain-containing protein [Parapedobacter sp.]HWK56518.1 DUF3037 domain-containing protein [Parapedobacter sp.]
MKTFEYQLLQFQPDKVSGEFLNIGVVVFDVAGQRVAFDLLNSAAGIAQLFSGIPTRYLTKQLHTLYSGLNKIKQSLQNDLPLRQYASVEEITRAVFPRDDSAVLFSDVRKTLGVDLDTVTAELAHRMITVRHLDKGRDDVKSDRELWAKVYKRYFDERNISQYLVPRTVTTKYAEITFDHSWQNGHVNFFESANFDLLREDSIKNKVRRWAGQIDELATSNEDYHLYLFSQMPTGKPDLAQYINSFLADKSTDKVKVEIVTPDDAAQITDGLKLKMAIHDGDNDPF